MHEDDSDPLGLPLWDELTFVGLRADPDEGGRYLAIGGYDRVLLAEAERSTRRAHESHDRRESMEEAGATAAAILCAAAACEARLSEFLVHYEMVSSESPEWVDALRTERDAREQWKVLLSKVSPAFSPGTAKEYSELGCLFRLRDLVAHRSARISLVDTFPPRLEDCVRQQVIPARIAQGADWTSVIFVHEVGAWAYQAAKSWLDLAYRLAPLRC